MINGIGHLDASIAGRRSSSFVLDLNADVAKDTIAVAARGELAGKRITMPRRAVLTSLEGGGYRLAPTAVRYGGGTMVADGEFGGQNLQVALRLDKMPLSLLNIAVADLGVGGTISGLVDYRNATDGLPRADIKGDRR